jgi:dipeptidase
MEKKKHRRRFMNKKLWLFMPAALAVLVLSGFLAVGRLGPAAQTVQPEEMLDREADNCTVVMVGKDASTDGSIFTTHTCDCGGCDWTFRVVPAADHKPGDMRKIHHIDQFKAFPPSEGLKWDVVLKDFTGVEIPQPAHTYGYIHGMFGYMNDQQVAIGESTIGNVRKLSNPTPTVKLDITMLTLLAMERARTAREAIKVMGTLAEKYGYGYTDRGEMLAVADTREVWIFEIMPVGPLWKPESKKPGAVWAAQRVPDDQVAVCPNESRIGAIDLSRPDIFMASPNYMSCAIEQKLYDPKSGQPFSWKKAYDPAEGSAALTARRARMWRFHNLVAPSLDLKPELANMDYPFSVKPDKKLSVSDVMAIVRDKSQGTAFDPVRGIRGGPFANPNFYRGTRLISVPNVEYTTITQTRGWLPSPLGGIVWLALGAQDTSCFVPLYAGITDVPESFKVGDHWEFSRESARWAFDYVDFHTQPVYSEAIKDVQAAQAKYEPSVISRIPEIDQEAAALLAKSPQEAAGYLTGFCLSHAEEVVKAWWKLGDDLLVKYNHLGYYDAAKRTRERGKPRPISLWDRAVRMMDIFVEQGEANN